jgi:hypothetical protein
MRKQEEVVLINYLISTLTGQVVLDESGDLRPWGWK